MFPSGSIYIENKIGLSTEPCATPWLTLVCTDDSSLICTNWNRSEKYDLNQFRAVPFMLINCSSLCNKIWWTIVLNAALSSNRTNPWSEAIRRSLVTFAKAVSVLWMALNPDWKSSYIYFFLRKLAQLIGSNFFKYFRQEGEVRYRSVIG